MKIIIEETRGTTVTIIEQFTKVSITDSVKFLELTDVYDKSFVGKNGFVPTVNETSGKLELKAPEGGGLGAVSSVFNRTGAVTAQNGDYTADQITETATKVFVTPAEKTAVTHANRSILDAIQEAFTTALKSAYDGVVSGYNALVGTGERLITSGEIAKLSNTSGTNTGDETTSTIQTKRPLKTVNGNSLEGVGNITITAGISDAPNDSNAYVRSGLAWVVGYTKSAIDTIISNINTALNQKTLPLISDGSVTAVTGVNVLTPMYSFQIPANLLNDYNRLVAQIQITKSSGSGSSAISYWINDTNTLSGATQIAISSITSTIQFASLERKFKINGTELSGYPFSASAATDSQNSSATRGTTAYDTTTSKWFIIAVNPASVGESHFLESVEVNARRRKTSI